MMRIFKIDGDPKRIWAGRYQMDNGGWYESDDIELSNKLEALAAHNYRVVVLEGTTPTEYFTAEQR